MDDRPALTAVEQAALDDLTYSWGRVYEISYTPPSAWSARRRDDRSFVQLPTAWQLRQWIRADYRDKPVLREIGSAADEGA